MGSVYVVSDVHGYRDDLAGGLRSAGLMDRDGHWSGGDDELWVLGDLVDRGPDGIGAIDLVRSLQEQAPEQVHVLMGNHEALALGRHRFPDERWTGVWRANGGRRQDQDALTDEHVAWLATLPLVARVGHHLLMHSDTTAYLAWGDTVEEINATVAGMLADPEDAEAHWEVFAELTGRFDFAHADGAEVAGALLERLGGDLVVHGHSIIGTLVDTLSSQTEEPLLYAGGRALAIDGGRYDGGPLLVVRLG